MTKIGKDPRQEAYAQGRAADDDSGLPPDMDGCLMAAWEQGYADSLREMALSVWVDQYADRNGHAPSVGEAAAAWMFTIDELVRIVDGGDPDSQLMEILPTCRALTGCELVISDAR